MNSGNNMVEDSPNFKSKKKFRIYKNLFFFLAIAAIGFVAVYQIRKKYFGRVKFAEVQPIIQKRCVSCHSAHPTDIAFKVAPNGISYDSPFLIQQHSPRIYFRAVVMKTMPLENKTGMTEEERDLIGLWIKQGADIR